MIKLREVCVSFRDGEEKVLAVDHANLSVGSGQLVLLTGASGSGKSTLLNVLSGLQASDSGQVRVADLDLATATESELAFLRLTHVGVIFQENNLIKEFTSGENVQLPLRARGYSKMDAQLEANSMLELVGLGGFGKRSPAKLSGGQRQRVGIARALVGGRSLLIADEPTGALDTKNSRAIFALLRQLADSGVCVVVASHEMLAEEYADRIVVMHDGRLSDQNPVPG